jgi:hypothetical protein
MLRNLILALQGVVQHLLKTHLRVFDKNEKSLLPGLHLQVHELRGVQDLDWSEAHQQARVEAQDRPLIACLRVWPQAFRRPPSN